MLRFLHGSPSSDHTLAACSVALIVAGAACAWVYQCYRERRMPAFALLLLLLAQLASAFISLEMQWVLRGTTAPPARDVIIVVAGYICPPATTGKAAQTEPGPLASKLARILPRPPAFPPALARAPGCPCHAQRVR